MLLAAYLTLFAIHAWTVSLSPSLVALAAAVALVLVASVVLQIALVLMVWKAEKSSLRKFSHFTEDG